VAYKFFDDQGNYLAALVAFYGLLSLFPLLLLLSSLLGFALEADPDMQHQILRSTLSQFPVIGEQLKTTGLRGSGAAVLVGVFGSIYGTLGVAQSVQNLMNVAWGVPRNRRPEPSARPRTKPVPAGDRRTRCGHDDGPFRPRRQRRCLRRHERHGRPQNRARYGSGTRQCRDFRVGHPHRDGSRSPLARFGTGGGSALLWRGWFFNLSAPFSWGRC